VNPSLSQSELAQLAASAFEKSQVAEVETVDKFAARFCQQTPDTSQIGKKRAHTHSLTREQLDSEPARPGEQVAAKVLQSEENGSWILANVLEYDASSQTYELQDEDDVNRTMTLAYMDVKRLEDTAAHLRRGDEVLAVFPETTSFYRALVVKNPRPPQHGNSGWDIVVRFEDDEDETGKAPARRVPARFSLAKIYDGYMEE